MRAEKPEPDFVLKPLTPVRKVISERVSESFRDVPQFDLHVELDATALKAARQRERSAGASRIPDYNAMLIFCSAKVLKKHPALNAHFSAEGIKEFSEINISFAVATAQGVFLPVIRNADRKSLEEIVEEAAEMVGLARAGKLRASFQLHGTFTVSSLGGFGIDSFNAVINPPQIAILAAGAIREKPLAKAGQIFSAPMLHLTLTVDHRAVDGDRAARFLTELKEILEKFQAT